MNETLIKILKAGVIGAWIFGMWASLTPGEDTLHIAGRALFGILILVHLAECGIFYGTLKKIGGSMGQHLLQTFIYGMIYVLPLKAKAAAGGQDSMNG